MNFRELHYQDKPLLLCNVWDASSAKVAEKLGFQAIGTASSAFADMFGYEDGKTMTFEEQKFMIERIVKSTNLPLTVDLEAGYSEDPIEIANKIKELAGLGVVGVNLEDSTIVNEPLLIDAEAQAQKFSAIKKELAQDQIEMFINARVDTYIMGFFGRELQNTLEETLKRVKLYEQAGVDGIFVPFISESGDIKAVTNATSLPVNMVQDPNSIDFDRLNDLGVKRVSMGNSLLTAMNQNLESTLSDLVNKQEQNSMESINAKKEQIHNEIDDVIKKRIYQNGVSGMTEEFREKLIGILSSTMDMTIATIREDGWPQANTVGFVNMGENIYLETFKTSSKVKNITRDPRVSITIAPPYELVTEGCGVSFAAYAEVETDVEVIKEFHRLLLEKFPDIVEATYGDGDKVYPDPNTILYRFRPVVASLLDFSKGFGHADFIVYEDDSQK
ncbi:isocitrate lyase/phosphoenolpyruvate mutase family protein [Marinifilum sp. D714]|uniref:isocitrate lyase/phosphoenolpyruvate mutase family protein n=1 Tax=Marinifilum sp. D714 TaxID=2937523 RepID=UPI0027C3BCDE|nr:isocitrate lyase/phosphoenolpyruvate mutase family protein [Marinifilum sp. D714]MDQ2179567.1 isocitrate lyase/phosphoenolpyruvate mutase family protein [Marinifilum sp. D714]